MLRLTIRHNSWVQQVDAPAKPVHLGADDSNEVQVPVPGVSRRHAVLEPFPGGVRIKDLGSKNGLIQGGERVATVILRPGERVFLGRAEVLLEEVESADSVISVALPRRRAVAEPRDSTTSDGEIANTLDGAPVALLQLVREIAANRATHDRGLDSSILERAAQALGARHLFFVSRLEGRAKTGRVLGLPAPARLLDLAGDAVRGMEDESTRRLELPGPASLFVRTARRSSGDLGVAVVLEGPATEFDAWQEEFLDFLLLTVARSGARTEGTAVTASSDPLVYPAAFVRANSPAMTRLFTSLRATVRSDLDVLLLGETGTGKEFLAEIVHASGPSASGPFVPINCAAIPSELLEAELFGVKARVATGVDPRQGLLVRAQGGCVFLDEIGDMPPSLQAKLLRALEEREVWPVGGHQPEQIHVRVISSTNRNLPELVRQGQFRPDLYYRLRGLEFEIPPLHERREDIPELAGSFAARAAQAYHKDVAGISSKALDMLMAHDWPGNIRELKTTVERAVLLCPSGGVVGSAEFESSLRVPNRGGAFGVEMETAGSAGASMSSHPPDRPHAATTPRPFAVPTPAPATSPDLASQVDALERRAILDALARFEGNKSKVARHLGITRNGLALKMKRLGIG
ncbi:MAG: sigma 54-interacting transcriptional regulator [Vicinamibacteria bacterium]|nr:sigma 54-interacting transcriptional regulator [Vicinamibacteria bacterium]